MLSHFAKTVTRNFILILSFTSGALITSGPLDAAFIEPAVSNPCEHLPPIDPNKDFIGNFGNPCYAIPMSVGGGGSGDLNAIYEQIFYKLNPAYELVVVGYYPNSRFFSAEVYDDHTVDVGKLNDQDIKPLNGAMVNPYLVGSQWMPNQEYGFTVGFGNPPPQTVSAGCSTADTTIDQNFMDASQIHSGITWTGYPDLPPNFPAHQTGPNSAGLVMLRRYVDISSTPVAGVIVRRISDGCAVPGAEALSDGILTDNAQTGQSWLNNGQIAAHFQFADSISPVLCWGRDPLSAVQWIRSSNFVAGNNDSAGYVGFNVTPSTVNAIIAGGEFIRFQFPLPTFPNTPCVTGDCSLTGQEQLRYFSISFTNKGKTLASLKDSDLKRDANGNVTLVIGMGTQLPGNITPADNITYFDLSTISGYKALTTIMIRNILPNASFSCSTFNVPFLTSEYNPDGGYMGQYVPTVDFPTATQLLNLIVVNRPDSCTLIPAQQPLVCGGGN